MTPRDDESLVSVNELISVLREHQGPSHPVANGTAKQVSSAPKRRRARQAALLGAVIAIALLLGSGLGFGLGSSVTPSGTARANVVGFGFLPARGWNVVQSGEIGPSGEARAIAANVALDPGDEPRSIPLAALEALPARGVVIVATFTSRGDPAEDFRFVVGELPLRIDDARPAPPLSDPFVRTRRHDLRAGIGGYNVDARIYFGASTPSPATLGATQRQLDRLVVASERVTLSARPAVVSGTGTVVSTTLFGSVDNGKAGEAVAIQARDCGQQFFRVVAGATTVEGGGWSQPYFAGITTTLRALWSGDTSTQITVRQRAYTSLRRERAGTFVAGVSAKVSFWRKRMEIQRFDRKLGTWKTVRTVVLTEQSGRAGSVLVAFYARFKMSVPKGTMLRAVLPASQARPCYLSGTSLPVRT